MLRVTRLSDANAADLRSVAGPRPNSSISRPEYHPEGIANPQVQESPQL